MIKFLNVNKAYMGGKQAALQGISFHLPAGSMVYLTGHSGAGKTTLLKLIMGIERANGGEILFNGHNITHLAEHELPFLRREIGMVHQDYRLLSDRTVLDNVSLPLIVMGYSPKRVRASAMEALERVGLEKKSNFLPQHLSGGEQQRVDIARAIVHRPQLLLADEPTGNLDDKLSYEIFRIFEEFNKEGTTVLVATHDTHIIAQRPHPRFVLEQGHLIR